MAIVEWHKFSGSSSQATLFQQWFQGEEFPSLLGMVETADLRIIRLPNNTPLTQGTIVKPGNAVAKTDSGSFVKIVEYYRFAGSSTEVSAFEKWFVGAAFFIPTVRTRDIRTLTLPGGEVASAGDWVGRDSSHKFFVLPRQD